MLTKRQEAFCLAYIQSGSAGPAYREAGYKISNPKTMTEAASRLLRNSKVAARIKELRDGSAKNAQLTLESHLHDLKLLRDRARKRGQLSAAITAEVARGRAAGLYVDRTELTGKNGQPLTAGVFVLPGVVTPEQWEETAKAQQQALLGRATPGSS